jgi:hypothetical protein
VDKLILEILSKWAAPTCVQANIYVVAKTLFPGVDIVKKLPSLKHIKDLRTTLLLVTKTLAASHLGNAKALKQLHTDATNHRQTSLVNVVMSFLLEDDKFKTICLDGAIIAETAQTDHASRAVINSFSESAQLLE